MKYISLFLTGLFLFASCTANRHVKVTVSNNTPNERNEEIIEISLKEISARLQLADSSHFIILDKDKKEIPYQITYDRKVIFPVSVGANSKHSFTIRKGKPQTYQSYVFGKQYPERLDDMAWENDKAAYRLYGPALQQAGQLMYGYDIWTKSTDRLIVDERYAKELDKETRKRIEELKKTDKKAADQLYKSISYHIDHGDGMDCYTVGPTLGGGTAALLDEDSQIIYPYCYKEARILDNGPLRFTVALTYHPFVFGKDSAIVEHRLISLDKGSHLNKTVVLYENLTRQTKIVTGIVIHPSNKSHYYDNTQGIIAYEDYTDNPKNNNGSIFIGAVIPQNTEDIYICPFSPEEGKKLRGGAFGHILAKSNYTPDMKYTYYWGSGWSKADIQSMDNWTEYLHSFAFNLKYPLQIKVE